MDQLDRLTYLTGDIVRRAVQLELGVRRLEGKLAGRPWTGMQDLPREKPFSWFASACLAKAKTWEQPIPGWVEQAIELAKDAYDERNRLTHDVWILFEDEDPDRFHPDRTSTMVYKRERMTTSIADFEQCVDQLRRAEGAVIALSFAIDFNGSQRAVWYSPISKEQTLLALRGGMRIGPHGRLLFDSTN